MVKGMRHRNPGPSAFLHTFFEDDGRVTRILSFHSNSPFGTPGVDYSAGTEVLKVPLYKQDSHQALLDRYRRALQIISHPHSWGEDGTWLNEIPPDEIARIALDKNQ